MEYNVDLCVSTAKAFLDIGHAANEADRQVQNKTFVPKDEAFYAFPAVVNLSFACELLLKAVLLLHMPNIEQKTLRGHKLPELFKMIPEESQQRIREAFDGRNKFKVSLDQTLQTHSNAFERWRYPYESTNKDIEAYPGNLENVGLSILEEIEFLFKRNKDSDRR